MSAKIILSALARFPDEFREKYLILNVETHAKSTCRNLGVN